MDAGRTLDLENNDLGQAEHLLEDSFLQISKPVRPGFSPLLRLMTSWTAVLSSN
jgi:hypothetical protein